MQSHFSSRARVAAAAALSVLAVAVASCGGSSDPATEIEASASPTQTFEPKQVEPKVVHQLNEAQHDDGLNATVQLQKIGYNNVGGTGTVVYFILRNDNDVPLPPSAIGDPKLMIADDEAPLMEAGTQKLDLPLGAHATVNLAYAFETPVSNLYNARLQIGNLIFEGSIGDV